MGYNDHPRRPRQAIPEVIADRGSVAHTADRDPAIGNGEDEANVRLMAAAPEMAEALRACLRGFSADEIRLALGAWLGSAMTPELHKRCDSLAEAHKAARAALVKAGQAELRKGTGEPYA